MTQIPQDQIPQAVIDEAKKQFDILTKGADTVTPLDGLMQKLTYSIYHNKPLKVKLGVTILSFKSSWISFFPLP